MKLPIKFSRDQHNYFFGDHGKYRVMTKGRRVGFTHGAANFCVSESLRKPFRFLWGDTVQINLDRYVERYFLPSLKAIPSNHWAWVGQKKELKICDSVIDFRSAERPENWEGFGYNRIILNEAGIILKGDKGRYLWSNAVLPMTADYEDCIVYLGGTPKGRADKDGRDCIYYELAKKADEGLPNYYHINIPTTANPFLNQSTVQEVISELPEGPIRDQEAYGKFVEAGASVIKREWFQYEDVRAEGKQVRAWDLAQKTGEHNDYTAGGLLIQRPNGTYQIADIQRTKVGWHDLKELIMSTAEMDGVNVPIYIEDAQQGWPLYEDLNREPRMRMFTIKCKKPKGNKINRAMGWVSKLETGAVKLLRGQWNKDFVQECISFTADDSHAHDDMIDSVSGAWMALSKPKIKASYI